MKRATRIALPLLLAFCLLTAPASAAISIADVPETHWAYPYASYMVEHDIMPLEDGRYFNPFVFTTRGEFVLYLWRAAGCPDIWVSAPTFRDVSYYDEYYDAVEWAVHHNITNGTSEYEFSPQLLLTRETAFTFLWRALPFFGYNTEGLDGRYINGFTDAADVSQWAFQAMNGLFALGIVNGDGQYLSPLRDVANSEAAAVLYRTLDLVDALEPDAADGYPIDFYIYNESDYDIYSVHVMPAYSDGEGVDILPVVLPSGGYYRVILDDDFVYAEDGTWTMHITDVYGYTEVIDEIFNPKELRYVDILFDGLNDSFFCDFVY